MKPVQQYLLVREIKDEQGKYLKVPDSAKVSLQKAEVVAISDDVEGYEPGDTVIYSKNNGHEYEDMKFILSNDLIGKIEK